MRGTFLFLLLVIPLLTFIRCGSDSASSSTQNSAFSSLAVTSPTAGSSSRSASVQVSTQSQRENQLFSGTPSNVKPLDTMITEANAFRDGNPTTKAAELGNPLSKTSSRAACYGPSWTDDAARRRVARPSGDLGIVYATASNTDTTACVAAQLNALVSGTPSLVNNFIKVQGIMIAAAKAAGKVLPGTGEVQDNLSVMPTISGLTFTVASLTAVSDSAGRATFKSVFTFTDTATSKTGTVTMYNTPLNSDNTNFQGLFQATLPQTSTSSVASHRGISVVFSQVDNVLTYSMKAAANRTTDSTDFFATDGQVDFSKAAFGEDGHWMIASFNRTTNAATVHYAWQAGSGDGSVRSFGIHIPAGTAGSLTGTGYFGFGAAMSAVTATSTPWITKMHCNWLSGGAGGASLAQAQRQTFTQTSGVYTVASNNWNFAPTDDCTDAAFTVSGADAAFLDGAKAAATFDLVAVPTASNLPAVTVPTFTIP